MIGIHRTRTNAASTLSSPLLSFLFLRYLKYKARNSSFPNQTFEASALHSEHNFTKEAVNEFTKLYSDRYEEYAALVKIKEDLMKFIPDIDQALTKHIVNVVQIYDATDSSSRIERAI